VIHLDDYKVILNNFVPKIEVGIPYFEFTTEFMAEVPYELEGWSNYIDFRDEPNLKEQIIAKFTEMAQMIIDEDFSKLMNNDKRKTGEVDFSIYMTEDQSVNSIKLEQQQLKEFKTLISMDNYELIFYADGRLVSLRSPEIEYGFTLDAEDYTWPQQYFLGKRKGSDKLEVIR